MEIWFNSMDAQLFVYTRNHDNDYKLVYAPSEEYCSREDRIFFTRQARGAINIESYSGNLDNPRWLFSARNNSILWGIGINNSKLSDMCFTDYTGTPVRGFFGLVIRKDSNTSIPYDLSFFKDFYSKYIVPIWNATREEFKYVGIKIDIDLNSYTIVSPYRHNLELNTWQNKQVILGTTMKMESVLEDLLSRDIEISFISGLSDRHHAFSKDYLYMNSIVDGVESREEKQIEIHRQEDSFDRKKTIILDDDTIEQKKVCRLNRKSIIGLLLVLILIILSCRIIFNQRKSNSGEKIKTEMNTGEKRTSPYQNLKNQTTLDSLQRK